MTAKTSPTNETDIAERFGANLHPLATVTLPEAAKLLNRTEWTINWHIRRGNFPAPIKLAREGGGPSIFLVSDILEHLRQRQQREVNSAGVERGRKLHEASQRKKAQARVGKKPARRTVGTLA